MWPNIKLVQDIIITNILTKFCVDQTENEASRTHFLARESLSRDSLAYSDRKLPDYFQKCWTVCPLYISESTKTTSFPSIYRDSLSHGVNAFLSSKLSSAKCHGILQGYYDPLITDECVFCLVILTWYYCTWYHFLERCHSWYYRGIWLACYHRSMSLSNRSFP